MKENIQRVLFHSFLFQTYALQFFFRLQATTQRNRSKDFYEIREKKYNIYIYISDHK
jgi:hypothetical protein